MGYGTREHQNALEKVGVTRHHRRSFQPIGDLFVGVI
jgi:ribonuclease HII